MHISRMWGQKPMGGLTNFLEEDIPEQARVPNLVQGFNVG